jgi:hypothetical protein
VARVSAWKKKKASAYDMHVLFPEFVEIRMDDRENLLYVLFPR